MIGLILVISIFALIAGWWYFGAGFVGLWLLLCVIVYSAIAGLAWFEERRWK